MSWPTVIGGIVYYVILVLGTLFYLVWGSLNTILAFLLVVLAPVTHLSAYFAHGFLSPIYFLGRFETLYIYLGVAALIGLLTGSFLYISSSMLVKALNLKVAPEQPGRTAASVRAARDKKRREDPWQAPKPTRGNQARSRVEDASKDYSEYFEKDRSKRNDGQGLISQTILEEDDDSQEGF